MLPETNILKKKRSPVHRIRSYFQHFPEKKKAGLQKTANLEEAIFSSGCLVFFSTANEESNEVVKTCHFRHIELKDFVTTKTAQIIALVWFLNIFI